MTGSELSAAGAHSPDPHAGLRERLDAQLEAFLAGGSLRSCLDGIAALVAAEAAFDACWIMLLDDRGAQATGGSWGMDGYDEKINSVPMSEAELQLRSPSVRAVHLREPVVVADLDADPAFAAWRDVAVGYHFRSVAAIPLLIAGEVRGVVNGYSSGPRSWSAAELGILRATGHHVAVAIHVAALLDRQREAIEELGAANGQLARQGAVLEQAAEIHSELTEVVLDGLGSDDVAARLAALLGRPVAVWDERGQLSHGAPASDAAAFAALRPAVAPSPTARPAARGSRVPSGVLQAEIVVAGRLAGYVTTEAREDDAGLDERALQHAATVLALVTLNARVAAQTEERLRADFVHELVTSTAPRHAWAAERGRRYGFRAGAPHRVLCVELTTPTGSWSRESDALGERPAREREEALRNAFLVLESRLPGALASGSGETLVVLAPEPEEGIASRLRDALARLEELWAAERPGLGVRVGGGSATAELDALHRSYGEAQRCLRIARALRARRRVLLAEELGVYGLLLDARDPAALDGLADRLLGPLISYDARGGDLMRTLRVLLNGAGAPEEAAAALHVHANTVRYRLRQIEELTGLDPRSAQDRLELALAVAIQTLRSGGPTEATALLSESSPQRRS